ncbi:hypothetical protein [Nocardioides bruguierae]|uniref:hypothetical protein n=1 Tax=Nocardioides bruguierae TaxID=2945102 RepID=UPI002021B972|nr:hypothetical protein [Nocardioides bruguierae]MCL8026161.1 hypothetical protein [Nocardioides bruguierae]
MRPLHLYGRDSDLSDTISGLLAQEGPEPPSQRRIAARLRTSPGTLAHEYGNRAGMLRRAAVVVAGDHDHDWYERARLAADRGGGLAALLPRTSEEWQHEVTWRTWCTVAVGRPAVAMALAAGHIGERRAVGGVLDIRLGGLEETAGHHAALVDLATAALVGLITRGTAPDVDTPWSPAGAAGQRLPGAEHLSLLARLEEQVRAEVAS